MKAGEYIYYSRGELLVNEYGEISLPRRAIVRCRDCEHARHYRPLDWRTGKPHETVEEWYCEWHSNAEGASEIDSDGFCAWGEHRD
jgi:hypothetical protein